MILRCAWISDRSGPSSKLSKGPVKSGNHATSNQQTRKSVSEMHVGRGDIIIYMSSSNGCLSSDQSSTSSCRYMSSGQSSPSHRYQSSDQISTSGFRYMSSGQSSASTIIKRNTYLDN